MILSKNLSYFSIICLVYTIITLCVGNNVGDTLALLRKVLRWIRSIKKLMHNHQSVTLSILYGCYIVTGITCIVTIINHWKVNY
jgi:hypothetical protein